MNFESTSYPAKISAHGVEETSGTLKVLLLSRKNRIMLAVAGCACAWLLAFVTLFIPIAHFVLVPLLLAAGPVYGLRLYQRKQRAVSIDGECPRCLEHFTLAVDKAAKFPFWDLCPHCGMNMRLDHDDGASTAVKLDDIPAQKEPQKQPAGASARRRASCLLLMLMGLLPAAVFAQTVTPAETLDFYDYSGDTGNNVPMGESPPVDDNLQTYGKWLYRGLCIRCHGSEGDGEGADWKLTEFDPIHWLPRQPRNFGDAVYKFRSTPSGSLPLDIDLFESISRGLVPETDMPSFSFLAERDRWALIAYIKSFSDRWVDEEDFQEPPLVIPKPPPRSKEMVAKGELIYQKMKCAECHGDTGIGDGPSADELTDDNDLPITPRDFSNPGEFVGPNDPAGIYRTIMTGLDGTPMPTFSDFLDNTEAWQLVYFVTSLRSQETEEQKQ